MEHFIEDLLITLNQPEWPASELLLNILSHFLANNISNRTEQSQQKNQIQQYKIFSIEFLGNILSKLKEEIKINKTFNQNLFPWSGLDKSTIVKKSGEPGEQEEDDRCICNQGYNGWFMLDCDNCHRWFHGHCVGVDSFNIPSIWFCRDCQNIQSLKKIKEVNILFVI